LLYDHPLLNEQPKTTAPKPGITATSTIDNNTPAQSPKSAATATHRRRMALVEKPPPCRLDHLPLSMAIRSIIYSNDRRPRLARHFVLWTAYAGYFTMQSYFPTGPVNGIDPYFLYVALCSTAAYFPFCVFCAWALMYYLVPNYLQQRRYRAFAGLGLALLAAGAIVNYFTGLLFYRWTGRSNTTDFTCFALGFHNVSIAFLTGIFLAGARLGRNAWVQQAANLRLADQKARAEWLLLKTRVDPELLFTTLDKLRTSLEAGSPGAPAAILELSDNLSESLYSRDEEMDLATDELPTPEDADAAYPTPAPADRLSRLLYAPAPHIRIALHVVFWLFRLGDLTFTYHSRVFWQWASTGVSWFGSLTASLLEWVGELALTYGIVYWFFPRFFQQRKYLAFAAASLTLLLAVFLFTLPDQMQFHFPRYSVDPHSYFWNSLMNFVRMSFATWLLFMAWRWIRLYHQRITEQATLRRDTAALGFQLLKAQVHPHFLFNTLNNIYSFSLDGSPRAGQLLQQLSAIMRYMIIDCEADRTPLDRELHLLEDYIGLEKVRYGERLDLHISIQGDTWRRRIAPLLMIPFVENCFKHGASQMLQRPMVQLQVNIVDDQLDFRLTNNTPPAANPPGGKSGIGLKNIRRRLELLYPRRHQLEISPTGDVFSVHLVVPLEIHND
jgi:hypothetical protein